MTRMRANGLVALISMTSVMGLSASATGQTVLFTDFDSGAPAQLSGAGALEGVQGYAGLGNGSNIFAGNFLRNDLGGSPAPASIITITSLPAHTHLNIDFLLAIIDSWDGDGSQGFGPDSFNVRVDGATVFSEVFRTTLGTQTYTPQPGGLLADDQGLGFSGWGDDAYDMSVEPAFHNIPHTASSVVIEFFGAGAGYQGGGDESWAIDRLQVSVVPVPAPASLAITGLAGLAFSRRRSR